MIAYLISVTFPIKFNKASRQRNAIVFVLQMFFSSYARVFMTVWNQLHETLR